MSMFKDKKVMYALIGGATLLVGAALIAHMSSAAVEENPIDDELDKLGPITREEDGRHLDFEYFIKVFELSSTYAKTKFSSKKKEYVSKRREAYNDDEEYKKIVMEMTQEEEKVIESQMMDIINKLGITEQEFQQNAMYHATDQMKQMKMMQVQQQLKSTPDGDDYPSLTKEKCLETFKVQVDIQMKNMEKMMNDPDMKNQMANPQNMQMPQDQQMNMVMKAMIEQAKAQDQLFTETGVEEEQLNQYIVKLKLENDPEFRKIAFESQSRAMSMMQQAQGGMGGGQGGPPMGLF